MGHHFLANRSSRTHDGEVSEWFKEPVLKTGDSERGRGFESHLLRSIHFIESGIDYGEVPKLAEGAPLERE